ncbi:MAG: PDZ domain-containing protein [Myxococcota bacterium]
MSPRAADHLARPHLAALAAVAVVGILVGAGITASWKGPEESRPAASAERDVDEERTAKSDSASELAGLRAELIQERERRSALEFELAMLRATAGDRGAPEKTPEKSAENASDAARQAWFDEASLIEQGIDRHRAEWVRERFEALQMDELYLRDQAIREGWHRTARFRNELWRLRAEIRNELGDDDYDLLQYASGRNNRVVLREVLAGSPAADAGVLAGDTVLRYDGRAIFAPHELVVAISQTNPVSRVTLDLLRNGERIRLTLPPGPLGARLEAARVFPRDTR